MNTRYGIKLERQKLRAGDATLSPEGRPHARGDANNGAAVASPQPGLGANGELW
jgi:hypothetical protein